MEVVGVDDTGAADASEQLSQNVDGDLAPGEVAERRERDRHRWVDVSATDPGGDPRTKCKA